MAQGTHSPSRSRRRIAAASALALTVMAGAASADTFIRIGSGLAGTYPIVGAKMAELINTHIDGVVATTVAGGTEANFVRLQEGEIEMLLTYSFLSGILAEREGSLGVMVPEARHLMTLYGAFFQPAARVGSGVESLAQVGEGPQRVWGASRASIFFPMIEAALAAHDRSLDDVTAAGGVVESIGYGDTTQAMQDGRLDVGFFAGPAPYSLLVQIERSPGFTLLGFDAEAGARFEELLPGSRMEVIPAGTYQGQDSDMSVPYVVNQLVVSASVPDDLVHEITRVLIEHHAEFHGLFAGAEEIVPEIALDNNPIQVHPGAARFYEEAGITARQ
jgi:hypothetical protein